MLESFPKSSGLSLVEVLVATAILTVSLLSLVPLFTLATSSTLDAAYTTEAAVLAQRKLEELRSIPASDPHIASASPPNTLQENIAGYVDFVDARGNVLDESGAEPPQGTSFTRRWSIDPVAAVPARAVVVQVLVAPQRDVAAHQPAPRSPGVVHLATVRAR